MEVKKFYELVYDKFNIEIKAHTKKNIILFEELFREYNNHTNLMSKADIQYLYEKHIFDSLSLNLFLCKYGLNANISKLLDIGAGGGFPSIPLAIVKDNLDIYALDSIEKKIKFIKNIQFRLRLNNLKTLCSRVEKLSRDLRSFFDLSTSRAVAPLNVLLEYAIPFIKEDGYFIAYKSKLYKEEINKAQIALKKLKSEIVDIIEYSLPLEENYERYLIIVQKKEKTPNKYPRSTIKIKSSPL